MMALVATILALFGLVAVAVFLLLRAENQIARQPKAVDRPVGASLGDDLSSANPQDAATNTGDRKITVIERRPDLPRPFGLRTAWLAVRTEEVDGLVEMLELADVTPANWRSGLASIAEDASGAGIFERAVFVTPPVEGWIFVVGYALPIPAGQRFEDALTPLMERLGAVFVEVQAYHCFPDLDLFAWARLVDGKLVRAFAWSDEGLVWNRGRVSKEELQLGLGLFGLRAATGRDGDNGLHGYPDASHVMTMAGEWSIDPTGLAQIAAAGTARPALGRLGRAPDAWRLRRRPRPPRPTGGDKRSLSVVG